MVVFSKNFTKFYGTRKIHKIFYNDKKKVTNILQISLFHSKNMYYINIDVCEYMFEPPPLRCMPFTMRIDMRIYKIV